MDELANEQAKRRVFLYFLVFMLIAMVWAAFLESSHSSRGLDEMAIVAISIFSIVYLMISRDLESIETLYKQNNIMTIVVVVMLVAKIGGFYLDAGVDTPILYAPVVISMALAIANRFV